MPITFSHYVIHKYVLKVPQKHHSAELIDKIDKKLRGGRIENDSENSKIVIKSHEEISPLISEICAFIPRFIEEIKVEEKKRKIKEAEYAQWFFTNFSLKNEHKHLEDLYNVIMELKNEIPMRDKEYAIGTVFDCEGLIELYKILSVSLCYRQRVKALKHIRSLDTWTREYVPNSIRELIYEEAEQ